LTGNFAILAGRLREVAARRSMAVGKSAMVFVARVCAEVQRRLWHPPLEDAADMSRWR
jgi:hypothetical protein